MSKKVNWIIADQNITVNYDGQTHILSREDANAPKLIAALKAKDYDAVPLLVSAAKRIETMSSGKFTVKDGEIWVDGQVVPTVLGRKIEDFANEGLPYEPLVLFAKNLLTNPSFRATQHLYQFLEKNNHPITENGCFIAYKKVRHDFKDIHSGTFDNSPGQVLEMPRNQVNEDPNQTCSYGLHVANFSYASGFGSGHMLEVEVHPADVVAIPVDYDQAKMRVCKYKVIGVVEQELSTPLRVVNPVPLAAPVAEAEFEIVEEDEEYECPECGNFVESEDDLCEDCLDADEDLDDEESSSSEEEDEDEDEDDDDDSEVEDDEPVSDYTWDV